jgi:hypothetical protein
MSNSYEAKDGSSARVIAAILAIVTLVVGGALLTMLGSQLLHGSNPSLLLIIVAIILAGVGRVLLELVGGAVLELIFRPVLSLFTRFVPKSSQERLNRVVGGPWLLLTILVLAVLGILAIALWFAG